MKTAATAWGNLKRSLAQSKARIASKMAHPFGGPEQVRKVDFVVAGTQKGGTSALDHYLRLHPEICMAKQKEVHFFDSEAHFAGAPDYSIYHAFFACRSPQAVIGEVTPIYMYWYNAPRRMWEYNPSMRIILVLRNPIDRAFSHWNMQRDRHWDEADFMHAVNREAERCREALPFQHRRYSYTDRGFYSEQIRRLWHYFPQQQTLILKNEALREDPDQALQMVADFLGVRPFGEVEKKAIHSRPYSRKMTEEERSYLRNLYAIEISNLESLLGWDCADWLA
jgi:hypothetical protein